MRLWCADAETPDTDRDKMFGFVFSGLFLQLVLYSGLVQYYRLAGKTKGSSENHCEAHNSSLPPSVSLSEQNQQKCC